MIAPNVQQSGVSMAVCHLEQCPRCGAYMREMLRAKEKSSVYIWFECPAGTCNARQLKQLAHA